MFDSESVIWDFCHLEKKISPAKPHLGGFVLFVENDDDVDDDVHDDDDNDLTC